MASSSYNPFLDEDDEEDKALRAAKDETDEYVGDWNDDSSELEDSNDDDFFSNDLQLEAQSDDDDDLEAYLANLSPDVPSQPSDGLPDEDDWGFEDQEPGLQVKPRLEESSPILSEDDWDFVSSSPGAAVQEDDDWGFEEDSPVVGQEEDWGFEEPSPTVDQEEDWGFEELDDEGMAPQLRAEDDEDDWSGNEADSLNSWETVPEEPEEAESGLANYLNQLSPEEEPTSGFKSKLAKLKSDIKSELRGGEEEGARDEQDDSGPGILALIFKPYSMLADLILKLMLTILAPLKRVPALARFIGPNLVLKIVSYILPLIIVALILDWQGSKPLPEPRQLKFPDEGAASIEKLVYDEDKSLVGGVLVNDGEVIAEVTVSFYVESIQPSLNPLSFFFPKPNEKCVSEKITIPIGESKEVVTSCPIAGGYKKMTAELSWK